MTRAALKRRLRLIANSWEIGLLMPLITTDDSIYTVATQSPGCVLQIALDTEAWGLGALRRISGLTREEVRDIVDANDQGDLEGLRAAIEAL